MSEDDDAASSSGAARKQLRQQEQYNLRPRSLINRLESEQRRRRPKSCSSTGSTSSSSSQSSSSSSSSSSSKQAKPKSRPPPLSKYRRRTANARERTRMNEINVAFEQLRRVVPHFPDCDNKQLTKITTLRLAMNYIEALSAILDDDEVGLQQSTAHVEQVLQQHHQPILYLGGDPFADPSSVETNTNSDVSSSSPLDLLGTGSVAEVGFGVLLESDGESLQLSDQPTP